jgi:hypothetical protein
MPKRGTRHKEKEKQKVMLETQAVILMSVHFT